MTIYTCDRCEKKFKQKYNLERHISRKNICKPIIVYDKKTTQYHINYTQITQNTTSKNKIEIQDDFDRETNMDLLKIKHICKYCYKNFKFYAEPKLF